MEAALLRIAVNPPPSLIEQLRDADRGVMRSIRRIVPDDDGVVLLFIDQFEELFTPGVGDAERDAFLSALAVAATDPATPLRLVLALRADFYDRPLRHAAFAPIVEHDTVAIGPLSPDEIERAIVEPAAAVGVGFEPGLVAEIVADVTANPGALPLMQYALHTAFDRRDVDSITRETYRSIGGVSGALAQRAEEIWLAATADEQIATRRLLRPLGDARRRSRGHPPSCRPGRAGRRHRDDDDARPIRRRQAAHVRSRHGVRANPPSKSPTKPCCAPGRGCAPGSTRTATRLVPTAISRRRRPAGSSSIVTAPSSTAGRACRQRSRCSTTRSSPSTTTRPRSSPRASRSVRRRRPLPDGAPGDGGT